jgi:4-oxalocrotonate tautomerase
MPIIQVSLVEGREPEKVTHFIHEVTRVAAETLDAPLDTIKVLVNEIPPTHWGSGGVTVAERRAKK